MTPDYKITVKLKLKILEVSVDTETCVHIRHTGSHFLYDFEIFVAVKTRTVVFWLKTPCLTDRYQSFGEHTASVFRVNFTTRCHKPENQLRNGK
jgi:hypothetical protein